jgi:hypothetical protein
MVLTLMDVIIVDEAKLFVIDFLDDIRSFPLLSKEWKRRLLGEMKIYGGMGTIEMGNANYYRELFKRASCTQDLQLPTFPVRQYYHLKKCIEHKLNVYELILEKIRQTSFWRAYGPGYSTYGWSGFNNGICQYDIPRTVEIINGKGYKEIPSSIPNQRYFRMTREGRQMIRKSTYCSYCKRSGSKLISAANSDYLLLTL